MDQEGGKKKRKKPTAKRKTRLRPKRVKSRRAQRVLNRRVEKRRKTLRGPPPPRPPPPQNYGSLGARLSDALSLSSLFKQPTPKKKAVPKPPSIDEILKAVGSYKQPLLELYEKTAERLRNAAPSEMEDLRKLAQQKQNIKELIENSTGDVRTALEEAAQKIDTELEVTMQRVHLKEGAAILDELKRTEEYTNEVKQAVEHGVADIRGEHKDLQVERERMAAELAEMGALRMEESAANEDLRDSIDKLRREKFAAEQELEQMRQRVEAEMRAKDDLREADMTAKEDIKEEHLRTEQELEQLREQVGELDAKARQIDELTQRVAKLQEELEQAKSAPMEAEQRPQASDAPPEQPTPAVDPVSDDRKQQLRGALDDTLKSISPLDPSQGGPDLGAKGPTTGAIPQEVVTRAKANQPTVVLATPEGPQEYTYKEPEMVPAPALGTAPPGGVDALMTAPVAAAATTPAGPPPYPDTPSTPVRGRTEGRTEQRRSESVKRPADGEQTRRPRPKQKQKKEGKERVRSQSKRRVEHSAVELKRAKKEYDQLVEKRQKVAIELDRVNQNLDYVDEGSAAWKAYSGRKAVLLEHMNAIDRDLDYLAKEYGWSSGGGKGDGTTDAELDSKMHKFVPRGFAGVIASDEIKDLKDHVHHGPETSFIMNLDNSKQPGSHWVPVYIRWGNSKSGGPEVDYADSFGDPPSKSTVSQLKELVKARGAPYMLKLKVNRIKSQRENSDTCGGHSMRFLSDMYDGKTFKEATGYTVENAEKLAKHMEGRGGVPRFGYI